MNIKIKAHGFVNEALSAHNAQQMQATASTVTDIKHIIGVINRHTGAKFGISPGKAGYKLINLTDDRSFTGPLKAKELLRFVGGFAAGVAFVKKQDFATTSAIAKSDDDTNHDFTSAVLALAVSDGVDDSFTGADDGVYYACVDFTSEVKTALKEKGHAQADSYSGVIIVFNDGEFSDDVDTAAFNFFTSSTEYEGEWVKAEETAGGRVDEDSTDDTDDTSDEDTDETEQERTQEDDAADTAVIALLDSGDCPEPDDSAESEDQSQQYSLYKVSGLFLDKLKSIPETRDYCDDMVGVIYWYGKEENETEFSESVTWYSDEDTMTTDWADITGQGE